MARKKINVFQAREYVCRMLAAEVEHHLGNGSEWLYPGKLSDTDHRLLEKEVLHISNYLLETAEELGGILHDGGFKTIP